MFENAGIADFYALFFVGFTDKANDPVSIGMFGSGFKLAIASALRLGIKLVLYIGREKVTFRTVKRDVKGHNIEQLNFVREINRLQVGFVRLPPHERNVSFVTCSRGRGEYQFSETLLKSGPRPISLALIDALAQTKSVSGKCDPRYEEALMHMVLDSVNGETAGKQ